MNKIIQPISSSEDILAARDSTAAAQSIAQPPQTVVPVQPPQPTAIQPESVAAAAPVQPQSASTAASVQSPEPVPASPLGPQVATGQDTTPYLAAVLPPANEMALAKVPVGVYIIAALSLLGAASEIGLSGTNALHIVVGVFDGLLAFGLLTRSNMARKIIVFLSVLVVIGSILVICATSTLQQK